MNPILQTIAAAAPASQATGLQALIANFMPLILIFGVMYFILIRPQQKKTREHQELLSRLKAGNSVVTSGGIRGTIAAVAEKTVDVTIADGVTITISRSAIAGVITEKAQ